MGFLFCRYFGCFIWKLCNGVEGVFIMWTPLYLYTCSSACLTPINNIHEKCTFTIVCSQIEAKRSFFTHYHRTTAVSHVFYIFWKHTHFFSYYKLPSKPRVEVMCTLSMRFQQTFGYIFNLLSKCPFFRFRIHIICGTYRHISNISIALYIEPNSLASIIHTYAYAHRWTTRTGNEIYRQSLRTSLFEHPLIAHIRCGVVLGDRFHVFSILHIYMLCPIFRLSIRVLFAE